MQEDSSGPEDCTMQSPMKRTDALKEVQHLKKLEHPHIVQVVGTYTFKHDLAILLYPAAEYNLETFMESIAESAGQEGFLHQQKIQPKLRAITTFFRCLAHAIYFLHHNAIKHMDIKPKNLLVKDMRHSPSPQEPYKIYIADFGIARSYNHAADAETDSPTSFTRMYAAPEVINQSRRGLGADIFSLGCVFTEMLAILFETDRGSKRKDLFAIVSSDQDLPRSYQSKLPLVAHWLREVEALNISNPSYIEISLVPTLCREIIHSNPYHRPSAETVITWFGAPFPCCEITNGPDPFSIDQTIEGCEDEQNVAQDTLSGTNAREIYLFQLCVYLQKQLRRVPGLRPWILSPIPDPYGAGNLDIITALWAIFRQGFPLIAYITY